MSKRKVTAVVPVKSGEHRLVIGHALVGDDGSIQVYLDLVPRGSANFKIHAEDEPVAEGTPHVFFTQLQEAIGYIIKGHAYEALTILESLPGYQDWLDDLDADDLEAAKADARK